MNRGFHHEGRVISIEGGARGERGDKGERGAKGGARGERGDKGERGYIEVEMEVQEACSGCQAKAYCGTVNGGERRVLRIEATDRSFEVGEKVEVEISYGMGFLAVMMAYILPLVLFVAVLSVCVAAGLDELFAVGLTLLAMVIYYTLLYIYRRRLERSITFSVRKKDTNI